jgi:hypothetical protein
MKNDMDKLIPQELIALSRFCSAAMLILNARLFTLIGMIFCATGFGWVMWEPDWIRAFAACAFSLLVFWPLARMEARREISTREQSDE